MDSDELQKYVEDLAANLKEAEGESLLLWGYFDEGSPTQSKETRTGFLTVLCCRNIKEDGHCLEDHNDSPMECERNKVREDENGDGDIYDTDAKVEDRCDGEPGLEDGRDDGDSERSCHNKEDDL